MDLPFYSLYYAAREAQILWKKRRQHAQGKISLNIDGSDCEWDEGECNEKIKEYAKTERWLWEQLPERARFEDSGADYVVDSLRVRFEEYEI